MNYMEGIKAGEYLFYLSLFPDHDLHHQLQKERLCELAIFAYLITIISLLFCYYQMSAGESITRSISSHMFDRLYENSLVISFIADHLLSPMPFVRINRNNEDRLS
jgi:hypothetical protein